jgi:hypothetical protein
MVTAKPDSLTRGFRCWKWPTFSAPPDRPCATAWPFGPARSGRSKPAGLFNRRTLSGAIPPARAAQRPAQSPPLGPGRLGLPASPLRRPGPSVRRRAQRPAPILGGESAPFGRPALALSALSHRPTGLLGLLSRKPLLAAQKGPSMSDFWLRSSAIRLDHARLCGGHADLLPRPWEKPVSGFDRSMAGCLAGATRLFPAALPRPIPPLSALGLQTKLQSGVSDRI